MNFEDLIFMPVVYALQPLLVYFALIAVFDIFRSIIFSKD